MLRSFILLFASLAIPVAALQADAGTAAAHQKRAETLFEQKRYAEAAEEFVRAAKAEPKDGAYRAARAGHIESWNLNDPARAKGSFQLAISMGGGEHNWIVRELGVVYSKLGEYDESLRTLTTAKNLTLTALSEGRPNEAGHKADFVETMAWIAHVHNTREEYQSAWRATAEALRQDPQTKSYAWACQASEAATWLGHQALVDGRFAEAGKFYADAISAARRNDSCFQNVVGRNLAEHERVARELERPNTAPSQHVFRACVGYVQDSDFDFASAKGGRVRARGSITEREVRRADLAQGLLQRYIEAFTGRALTLTFARQRIAGTLRDMSVTDFGGQESRVPVWESAGTVLADYFFAGRETCDGFFLYWNGRGSSTTANGGLISYPYVPYQLYGPLRGFVSFPANWESPDAALGLLHEFFHVTEGAYGITPTHGFQSPRLFPDWKGSTQFDFFRYHFERAIRQKFPTDPWRAFAFHERYKERVTPANRDFNRQAVSRKDSATLRRAHELAGEASALYYSGKDRARGDALFRAALELNPQHPGALRHLAGSLTGAGQFAEAEGYLQKLVLVDPDVWALTTLGALRVWNLGRPGDALAPLEAAIALAGERGPAAGAWYNLAHAYLKLEKHKDSLGRFERVALASDSQSGKPTLYVQSQFWRGYILGEKLGQPEEAYQLIRAAVAGGWDDDFSRFYLRKYTPGERALARSVETSPPLPRAPAASAPPGVPRGFVSQN